ncbi:hypothetical protein ABK040_008148 [Willaertia magna]
MKDKKNVKQLVLEGLSTNDLLPESQHAVLIDSSTIEEENAAKTKHQESLIKDIILSPRHKHVDLAELFEEEPKAEHNETVFSQRDIEDYSIIGNCNSAALVSKQGSIDFCCLPRFDSDAIFNQLLDASNNAGYFSIHPVRKEDTTNKQHYFPDSNVLVTKYLLSEGVGQVVDFMPMETSSQSTVETMLGSAKGGACPVIKLFRSNPPVSTCKTKEEAIRTLLSNEDKEWYENCIVRRLEVIHGRIEYEVVCCPVFSFGRDKTTKVLISEDKKLAVFESDNQAIILQCSKPVFERKLSDYGVQGTFSLVENEPEKSCVFVLRYIDKLKYQHYHCHQHSESIEKFRVNHLVEKTNQLTVNTILYWQEWIKKSKFEGRFREMVNRSLLCLKLLTCRTGAIISSPTTSLPKTIGGNRNYDYRFCWIRDASFAMQAYLQTGMIDEASSIINFLKARIEPYDPKINNSPLSNVYSIDGNKLSKVEELTHLTGYHNSKPVRIGNTASTNVEMDIYGELLFAIFQYDEYRPISYEFWCKLKHLVDYVIDNWKNEDKGFWESKVKAHYVNSKVMSWCCIDKALRIAKKRSFPADVKLWHQVRDDIYEDVMSKGYDEEHQCFVQYYGAKSPDVTVLIMPVVGFLPVSDPRMIKTINFINRRPKLGGLVTGCLVYRHHHKTETQEHKEATFNMLTFWLLRVLALMGATDKESLRKAQLMFEEISTYCNHSMIYSEQTSFSGSMLGNAVHLNTHSSLIHAASELARHLK